MIQRAFRYRLYPTAEQAELLEQTAGVVRLVYNLALEQRSQHWRQFLRINGRHMTWIDQANEIAALRAAFDWIAAVSSTAQVYAVRQLDTAFRNYFSGRARYPTPRRKGVNDGFRLRRVDTVFRQINNKWAAVRIPKIGFVRLRLTRAMRGRTVAVSINRDGLGWHASFANAIEHEAPANDLPPVGIDRGIANTLALSTGELISTPDLAHLERRKKRAQRILARRVRGSARYRKQRRRLGSIAARISRCRKHWQHEVTTSIARRFGHVSLEALHIPNMTASGRGKRGLNRSILEQGWGGIETALAYKLEERGGTLIKVNPAFTSQECSACGAVDKASRESQSRFACRHCGFTGNADTNAALNILRRSTSRVEGSGCAPVEARTINLAA